MCRCIKMASDVPQTSKKSLLQAGPIIRYEKGQLVSIEICRAQDNRIMKDLREEGMILREKAKRATDCLNM